MRILAITNLFPTPMQPTRATFNRQRLRLLAEHHPVRVITPIAWTDEVAARRAGRWRMPDNRQVTLDGITIDHPRFIFPPKFVRSWWGHFFLASIRRTAERARSEFRPDVIFAAWAYPDGWAAVQLGKKWGIPVVIQCHGSDILLLDQHPEKRARTKEAVLSASGVVAVSRDIAVKLGEFGVPDDNIRLIYSGVDKRLFHPGSKSKAQDELSVSPQGQIILFVGNLVPVKAVDVLIAAFSLLVAEGLELTLLLVGDGPLRTELQAEVARRGVANRVRFVGIRPHAELAKWFRAADLLVLPSKSEGVPNVLLEASACGTPWVASRVGGIPEIAHIGAGRMTPANSPIELAATIRESLSDHGRASAGTLPRSTTEAVDDLATFLQLSLNRHNNLAGQRNNRIFLAET